MAEPTEPTAPNHLGGFAAFLKSQGISSTALTMMVSLGAIVSVYPQFLPYALGAELQSHVDTYENVVAKVATAAVRVAILQSNIRDENVAIGRLDAQILSNLCMPNDRDPCIFEKTMKEQAKSRREDYQRELATPPT